MEEKQIAKRPRDASQKTLITYKGETKSLRAWSKEYRLDPKTVSRRYIRYEDGFITLDELFSPPARNYLNPNIGAISASRDQSSSERMKPIMAMVRAYNKFAVDTGALEKAVEDYIEQYGPLKFMKDFGDYYKSAVESVDNANKPTTQIAIGFALTPADMHHITKL